MVFAARSVPGTLRIIRTPRGGVMGAEEAEEVEDTIGSQEERRL